LGGCRKELVSRERQTESSEARTSTKSHSCEVPREREKAEIAVDGDDDLYCEIRVKNAFEGSAGNKVKLQEGTSVQVTIEADEKDAKRNSH
jgi:hypothetical protein